MNGRCTLMSVLVAYASCHGSTRGVAERIGGRLRRAGLPVEVHETADVEIPGRYQAAVVGSAIHGGRWLPEAAGFLEAAGPALRGRPVWLFSVSTVGDAESMFPPRVARLMRTMRSDPPTIRRSRRVLGPIGHRNFAGRVAPRDWPLPGRLFFAAVGGRYGDHRNWAAIDAWSDGIAARLGSAQPASPSGGAACTSS